MKKTHFFVILMMLVLASCAGPRQVAYFQDVLRGDTFIEAGISRPITVQSGDKLMIVVHSSNPQLAAMFNLPVTGTRIGMPNQNTQNSTYSTMSYTVAPDGTIDFPEIGIVNVKGMTRDEVARTIKQKLVEGDHCKDAVVTVEMDNMYVSVLGEVNRPGRYAITKDVMTLDEALGLAGDLNIQGKRQNIVVARTTPQGKQVYTIDMTNMKQMLESPAYYLQQGDMVYVEPNDYRKRQTTVNGNNALSTGFWISVGSLLTSIASIVVLVLK